MQLCIAARTTAGTTGWALAGGSKMATDLQQEVEEMGAKGQRYHKTESTYLQVSHEHSTTGATRVQGDNEEQEAKLTVGNDTTNNDH